MNNEEIKALLQELKARSDEGDAVKGETVRISLTPEKPPKKAGSWSGIWKKRSQGAPSPSSKEDEAAAKQEKTKQQEPLPEGKTSEKAVNDGGTEAGKAKARKVSSRDKRRKPYADKSVPGEEKNLPGSRKSDAGQKDAEEVKSQKISPAQNKENPQEALPAQNEESPQEATPAQNEEKPQEALPAQNEEKTQEITPAQEEQKVQETMENNSPEEENRRNTLSRDIAAAKADAETGSRIKSRTQSGTRTKGSLSGFGKRLRLTVSDYFSDLNSKGIGGKELLMLAFGLVLVILILCIMINTVQTTKKSENVTADEGLTVTVEREPDQWCSSAEVELGIRTGAVIQSITVNGEACEFEAGRGARIKVMADRDTLDIMVVSQEKVFHATVDLPWIDAQEPNVNFQAENGQVTLLASDSRSGLDKVYYGAAEDFSDVPLYQEYTGPFTAEEEKIYYYYAQDLAGNRTTPAAATTSKAQSLAMNVGEAELFPGETLDLKISSVPEMAYYNNLKLTNSNTSVASLDENCRITALAEGTAVIEASAEGLSPISCTVNVRTKREMSVSALGDCTLGSDISFNTTTNFDAYYTMYGAGYFFQNVRSLLAQDDITFANLEGTLTTADTRENKEYAFKGDPAYAQVLLDGSIEAVTLANNHSSDYGAQSLEDTKQALTAAGVDYCNGTEIILREEEGVKVALIGIYVLAEGTAKADQVRVSIQAAKDQGARVIIVAFHWGDEKSETPDETQRTLAHLAVDCGASLVVGHHPHVLQGIELYKGAYIAYSLGNFCFGGNNSPSDMDTIILRQNFLVSQNGTVENGGIQIYPCSISSQVGWNDYCPTPVWGDEAQRIMDKLNQRSAEFGQSYEYTVPEL